MNRNFLPLLLFLLVIKNINGQNNSKSRSDSLIIKSYEYLDDKIYELKNDSVKASPYLYSYLNKAKKEKNYKELISAYQNILHQSPMNLRLKYADSMVSAALKSHNKELIGSAYLSKGIVYYSLKKYTKAYDYYIKANEQISATDNKYLIYKTKYNIAQIKYYLGLYDEAVSLLRECIEYFRKNEPRPYLNSLHSLSVCYNRNGDYTLCTQTNSLGLEECERLKIPEMTVFFKHSEGINQYFLSNYSSAVKMLRDVISQLDSRTEFANESIANFYIGKSYWKLHLPAKAIPYFEKVNKTFIEKGYIRPDLREVFELLIKYYKKENDLKSQLYYMDQLLKADTLLTDNSIYLRPRIHKEYDAKEIILEKDKIQKELLMEKYYDIIFIGIIIILFSSVLFGTYKFFEIKKRNKLRYEDLLQQLEKKKHSKTQPSESELSEISAQTLQILLQQLVKFEKGKKYLNKDITLETLAVSFNTNSKYLSRIIYQHRGKKFPEYLNDLRIDYLIDLLHNSKVHRKHTISSLADQAGFSTTPRFTNAFKSKAGISFSYFLKHLKKENS